MGETYLKYYSRRFMTFVNTNIGRSKNKEIVKGVDVSKPLVASIDPNDMTYDDVYDQCMIKNPHTYDDSIYSTNVYGSSKFGVVYNYGCP